MQRQAPPYLLCATSSVLHITGVSALQPDFGSGGSENPSRKDQPGRYLSGAIYILPGDDFNITVDCIFSPLHLLTQDLPNPLPSHTHLVSWA